jgi:hypothetical protein
VSKRGGVEQVIRGIDFVRGLGGLLLLAGIGVAAIVTGGLAGWLLGAGLVGVSLALFVALIRSRS